MSMLSRLKTHHSKKYQPSPRLGHSTAVSGDRLYLWAGWQKSLPKLHSGGDKYKLTSIIEVFSLKTGEWSQLPTSGIPPLGIAYYACTCIDDDLYYYGGRCGHAGCHHNTLHRLNTVTMRWKEVSPSSSLIAPMKKAQCGIVSFKDKNKYYLFVAGGYGVLPTSSAQSHHDATYIPKRGKPEYGWTNEAHVFDIHEGDWIVPEVSGEVPLACSNFSFTAINENQAVMMGGFCPDGSRLSCLYVAELRSNSVFWSKLSSDSTPSPSSPWPEPICDQVSSFVSGIYSSHQLGQYLVSVGGESDSGHTLSICWLLELPTRKWKRISTHTNSATRLYHSMSSFTIGPHCVWLVMFGGVSELVDMKDWQDQPMLAATLIIELVLSEDEKWTSNTVYDSSQPHSAPEDYQRRLTDRMLQARREWIQLSYSSPFFFSMEDFGQVSLNSSQLSGANSIELPTEKEKGSPSQAITRPDSPEKNEKNKQLEQNTMEVKELEGDLLRVRTKLKDACQQWKQAEEELTHARSKIEQLQEELLATKTKSKDMELKSDKLIQHLQLQLDNLSPATLEQREVANSSHWEVLREDIHIQETVVHKGDWGIIKVATYCGLKVAAMTLRESVSSTDFRSAMVAASSLHCPGLIQLIGATNDAQPPLILTELILTTISKQLEAGALARSLVVSVAKDVTAALCYLHHCRPSAIAHGYVSSATVVLERYDHSWRAKLHNSLLLHPVPPRSWASSPYTAPEVANASKAEFTPESDIFSFGILLIEMATRESPASSAAKREQQVRRINWPGMVPLMLRCTASSPLDRPIIQTLVCELSNL